MERSTVRWIMIALVAFVSLVIAILYANRPLAKFKTPSGGEIVVHKVTFGPTNRFPILSGPARLVALVERIVGGPTSGGSADASMDGEPVVLWMSISRGSAPVLRVVHGGVEGPLIRARSFPVPGGDMIVHGYALSRPPRGVDELTLEWYEISGSQRVPNSRTTGNPAHTMTLDLKGRPPQVEGWAPDTTMRATNGPITVELVGFEMATNRADHARRDTCLISLRVWENGEASTNWSVARVQEESFDNGGRWTHVANRDFVAGVMRIAVDPVWLDGSVWLLKVGVVRKSGFPTNNLFQVRGPTMADLLSPHSKPVPPIPFSIEGGRIVAVSVEKTRLYAPAWLEAEAPFFVVSTTSKMAGTNVLPVVGPGVWRLASVTDSGGNRLVPGRWAWTGAAIYCSLQQDAAFSNSVPGPLTVVVSREPVFDFTFKVRPTAATNESAWPREEPRKTH